MASESAEVEVGALEPIPARSRRRGIILRLLIYIAALYVIWCILLYYNQDRLLFPADMAPSPGPQAYRYTPTTAEIRLPIETGGEVVAWFVPAHGASAAKPAPVAIFFHGNAEIIDYMDEIVTPYRKVGVSVFLPEYRGYGRSAGKPSETALVGDSVRFYDELVKRPDVDKSRIVIHGRSLGGGPACALAAQRTPRAMILQSAFTSAADLAHKYAAPGFIATNPFHNDRILPTLEVSVLIAHGSADEIIPVEHGRALAKLAKHAKYLEYNCMHNGFPGEGNEDAWWREVTDFLKKSGVLPNEKP